MKTLTCSVCDADIYLDDEEPGEQVFCSYCKSTLKIRRVKGGDDIKLVDDN